MIKQEIIEKLIDHMIISNEGKHGGRDHERELCDGSVISLPKAAFEQRARELGYINGYRWGVEYPTNGKKPDLPEDTSVQVRNDVYAFWTCGQVGGLSWPNVFKFKITDQRYKPVNLDYLYDDKGFPIASGANTERVSEIPESKSNAENVSDWWDYETQKAVALPPVGDRVSYSCIVPDSHEAIEPNNWYYGTVIAYHCGFVWTSDNGIRNLNNTLFRPLDHNRKAEAEKKRVVDAAFDEAIKLVVLIFVSGLVLYTMQASCVCLLNKCYTK